MLLHPVCKEFELAFYKKKALKKISLKKQRLFI